MRLKLLTMCRWLRAAIARLLADHFRALKERLAARTGCNMSPRRLPANPLSASLSLLFHLLSQRTTTHSVLLPIYLLPIMYLVDVPTATTSPASPTRGSVQSMLRQRLESIAD